MTILKLASWATLIGDEPTSSLRRYRNPDRVKQEQIETAVRECGSISGAAKALNMHRRTIQRMMNKRHPEYRMLEVA